MTQTQPVTTPASVRARRAVMNSLLIFLIGVFVARLPTTLAQMSGKGGFTEVVSEVYEAVMAGSVDPPDAAKLQRGAINGMLEALNDDYAEYVPEDEVAAFEKEMTGHFSGIGCQIEIRDGWLTVVTPLEDSPAYNAGIMAGDRISKIGDKSTFKLSADECIKLLTGEPGTPVSFTVQRDGKEMPFTLTRAPITSRTVRGLTRSPGGGGKWNYLIDADSRIAYIRLSQFTPTASREVAEAIADAAQQAGDKGLGGMILDLRNNPGGVMDGALEIADMFLDDGVIMSIRGRGSPPVTFTAEKDGTLPDFPLAILVNEGSASASEIVSGSLQDRGRAIVVGTRTFGKGLVQTVAHLRHAPKAELKFTTQRYYLPSGRLIQRTDEATEWGVDPSPGFYVPMTDREQIQAFMKRRDWDVLRKEDPTVPAKVGSSDTEQQKWSDPAWIRTAALDKQLAAALEAVQTRLAGGSWKPVSDAKEQHGKLAVAEAKTLQKDLRLLGLQSATIAKRLAALRKQAQTGEPAAGEERVDLWPDALDPTGGHVDVFDKEGHRIAKLTITGPSLEQWLLNADVEPSPDDSSPGAAAPGGGGGQTPPAGARPSP